MCPCDVEVRVLSPAPERLVSERGKERIEVKTTLSERDGNTVKLAVEVSSEELNEAFTAQLRKLSREIRLPGFRPGKAPAGLVRQRLGDQAILFDALEESIPEWFAKAALELGLEPVDRPEIELGDDVPELDKPLSFTAKVTVMPEVVLGQYKGLEVAKDPVEVKDEEVDEQVERLRDTFSELKPVEGRPAQNGDYVIVDVTATIDGERVENLEAADFLFEIGGGRMLPAIEEQVIGMNAGEQKTFSAELPAEFPEELRGKTAEFTVRLKDIKEKVLPPLSDGWVSEISEFATLLELRQEIRGRLRAAREQAAEQRFRARGIKEATNRATLELPEVLVQEQAEQMLADFTRSLESQGASLEAYVEATGISKEQILEDMKQQAAAELKTDLVLKAVAKAEELEASEEEVAAMVSQMAAMAKVDPKDFETRLRQSGRIEAVREQILRNKAADLIAGSAVAVSSHSEQTKEESTSESAE